MKTQPTARVSWSLLVTLCIWVASGEALARDRGLDGPEAQQSTALSLLLDCACMADPAEEAQHVVALDRQPADRVLARHATGICFRARNGSHGHFHPLARAPGL